MINARIKNARISNKSMCANIVNKEENDFTDCGYRQMPRICFDFQRSILFLHLRVKHIQIIS